MKRKLGYSFKNNYVRSFFQEFKLFKGLRGYIIRDDMMKYYFCNKSLQSLNQEEQELRYPTVFSHKRLGNIEMSCNIVKSIQDIIKDSQSNIRLSAMKMRTLRGFQKSKNKFSEIEADSYLLYRMPQVYASLYNVINELRSRLGEEWVPENVLDCGEGPGIGALVIQELFSNSIEKVKNIIVVEPIYTMRKRALYLHKANKTKIISNFSSITKFKFDFIIANHTILDTNAPGHISSTYIKKLWAKVSPENGILLLLERGNPLGYEAVVKARQIILFNSGSNSKESEVKNIGHVISPCPHDKQCPLYLDGHRFNSKKWCHFGQRLITPAYLQKIKHSFSNIENSKFSYCIIRKEIVNPSLKESKINLSKDKLFFDPYGWHRLILPPLKKHGHVIMDTCVFDGTIKRMIISKSHGKLQYQNARKAYWGDIWALKS
ncbi:hypothetical protein T552_00847 [Pneumocystis carinii B80]|uniref:Mitochondrial small ribosomal subunit Rsm22 n=1 Tax=Pneumocystis carinii (strain B80) TaxID=1408658 RepID=A0A0W4ZPT7_PNEC8|nr:hypothetical protein T552_00847 [Pneumocystis carinii B80]KTW30374.1 hypothetical protein T552_00847 [Pneumocystis carinii B80]